MLRTGAGYWDPIAWLIVFIVALVIAYILRGFGKKEHRKEAEEPFFSGIEIEGKEAHVRASNIYWGFIESMKGYYEIMEKMHDGIINNYIGWFVFVAAILFITIFIQGVIP